MQLTLRFVPAPRYTALLVVLAVLLAIGAVVVVVGSMPRRADPFGLARNGPVAFGGTDGDVYLLDPATGISTPILTGIALDFAPIFSPDGSRLMFVRADRPAGPFQIMLANPDGGGIRTLSDPLTGLEWVAWSPDGSRLAVISELEGGKALWILAMNGNSVRLSRAGMTAESAQWRPDGRELVFRGVTSDTGRPTYGLYAVEADGGDARPIAPPTESAEDWQNPALSPDGTRIIYTQWDPDIGGHLWVVPVNGGNVSRLVFDGPLASEYFATWSADGAQIVFHRWSGEHFHLAIAPADGGAAVEIGPAMLQSGGAAHAEFSPDGSKVIARYNPDASIWILDVTGGGVMQLPASDYVPSWQRLAP